MRFIKVIDNPTQRQVYNATCGYSAQLGWNEEVHLVHWGEDGLGLIARTVRHMFIEDQNWESGLCFDEFIDTM